MGIYVLGSPVFANATVAVPTGACARRWPLATCAVPLTGFPHISTPPACAGWDAGRTNATARLQLTVRAHNASAANIYVAAAAANGASLGGSPFVLHTQLWPQPGVAALLEFWMTDSPAGGLDSEQ